MNQVWEHEGEPEVEVRIHGDGHAIHIHQRLARAVLKQHTCADGPLEGVLYWVGTGLVVVDIMDEGGAFHRYRVAAAERLVYEGPVR